MIDLPFHLQVPHESDAKALQAGGAPRRCTEGGGTRAAFCLQGRRAGLDVSRIKVSGRDYGLKLVHACVQVGAVHTRKVGCAPQGLYRSATGIASGLRMTQSTTAP